MSIKDKLNDAKERVEAKKQQQTAKALNKLVSDIGSRGEKLLAKNMDSGEEILAKIKGDFGQALVVTNKHVFIVKWGFQSGSTFGGKCTSFAYSNITAIQIRTQTLKSIVEVLSPANQSNTKLSYWGGRGNKNNAMEADNAVTFNRAHNTEFQTAVNLAKEQMQTKEASTNSEVDQLEKLAKLKAQGHLTQAEFNAKKKQILGL